MADNSLLEKVLGLQEKFDSLQAQLSDPEVIGDMKRFVQLNKEYKELMPILEAGNEFKKILENYEMAKDILANEKDEDLREMAKEEIAEIEPTLPEWEEKIKLLLIPADPQDSKNAILEIRGGSGGDEAAIFAGDLFRIQQRLTFHRHGLIVCGHRLCLSREEEFRILPAEVEGFDNMAFAQFFVKACVKLRYTSSVRIETGQYGYLQDCYLFFLVLCLDVLVVESCEHILCDVKACIGCDYRCSA